MKTAWNPFSQDVPFITFASHPIYWHKEGGLQERSTYDMELFAQKLQRAVEAIGSACIHHSPIVIQSYLGLTSLLHNKTSMGFLQEIWTYRLTQEDTQRTKTGYGGTKTGYAGTETDRGGTKTGYAAQRQATVALNRYTVCTKGLVYAESIFDWHSSGSA
ncbi:unnamed protein product [Danaus chrysippus]|uniref:(African queen) hypothetical protein n=1 Tax=Danaus chrysippus TaxID=151541 RepID=A0A8J2R5U4_9NEOP|nr:unnamed protein product [Danaus chrysippus]